MNYPNPETRQTMFQIGRPPPTTPEQRRQTHHQRIRERIRQRVQSPTEPIEPWKDFHSYSKWNIVPKEKFRHIGLFFSMNFAHNSFAHRYTHFQQYSVFSMRYLTKNKNDIHPLWADISNEAREKYFLNQKLRWAFKRLVNRFLSPKMKIKNDVDPVSLETPKQTVTLCDVTTRTMFVFEAKNLLGVFRTNLLSHEEIFPIPIPLRNPLTNSPLTFAQILSAHQQIKQYGHTHWTLECFRDARYSIDLFCRDNHRKLCLSALQDTLKSPSTIEFLLDFIKAQHQYYNMTCDLPSYRWALLSKKWNNLPRLESWKHLCYLYYEIELTEDDLDERRSKQRKLGRLIKKLCAPCNEIHALP